MKLIELEISNIRGIKEIKISPNGENVVIFGPNGTGKSAVVDSIEFLLTGKISRLMGEGAGGLSIKEHGPHVDYRDRLKEAIVRAKIKIDNGKEVIELERKMSSPRDLKIKPQDAEGLIKPYLDIAELGQHVLSRREILKYITAEAGKRAKEVQSLLNLDKIENIREEFVTVKNNAEKQFKISESVLKITESNILVTLSLEMFSVGNCLNKINELRSILGALAVTDLSVQNMKTGIVPPGGDSRTVKLSITEVQNYIKETRKLIKETSEELILKEQQLKKLLDEIAKDIKLKRDLLHKKLLDIGINLIDETNVCPLCEREWPTGQLRDYLEERIKRATLAQEKQNVIIKESSFIKQGVDLLKNYIINLVKALKQFGLTIPEELEKYTSEMELWSSVMLKPEEFHESNKWPSVNISRLFEISFIEDKILKLLEKAIQESGQKVSKEQDTWDTLTKMETLWEQYESAFKKMQKSRIFKERADSVLKSFEEARDSVLKNIYDSVKDNFTSYYRCIHTEDEKDFKSDLKHKGPALIFEVDFYNRGLFPPHALHSEGHQDSMGLCLYFALNKYLTRDLMKLTVLDDVVMSIDSSHRRGVCKLLKQSFQDRQFIITTHDPTWARQLRTEGIVNRENMIHFVNWDIETGPIFEFERDVWDKIEKDLSIDDIPSAAQKLRRNAECFFENVCDSIGGKILYKGDHRWELGDYAPAAVAAYKDHLKKAKKVAQELKDMDKFKILTETEEKANKIINNSQIEQWIVNENVHYNRWANFSKQDIKPVIEVFKELFGLFICDSCHCVISLNYHGHKLKSTSCKCGNFYWNLLGTKD